MFNGYRVIDADSHVMEPDDLWDRYLDRRFQAYAPKTRRLSADHPYFMSTEVAGHKWEARGHIDRTPYLHDGRGGFLHYTQVYGDYIRMGWSAEAYLLYMDRAGIDYAVLYPTLALHSTAVPELDPKAAAAIKRAYNDWLHDFCNAGQGRLIGVAALDLRDVGLAVQEARRCVRELGCRAVYILPETPAEGMPLDHPTYDPLWAEIASLGVALGTHEAMFHKMGSVGYAGAKQVAGTSIAYAPSAATFGLGEMLAGMMFAGMVCARHPDLRVIFTESSIGWAATWLPFLDEKWERASTQGAQGLPPHKPSHYFRRQCYISGEPGERAYAYAIDAGFEDCLMTATDFPHPEVPGFPRVLDPLFAEGHGRLQPQYLRKILWDTPAKVFRLA